LSEKLDFIFICDLAQQFFRKTHVRRALLAISEDSMTGWEKWLQIELAQFLRDHKKVKAWWRESKYALDGRLIAARKKCAVDFLIHQKGKQSHMALELKQANAMNNCIAGMLRDLKKISCIRGGAYDIRSVWCLGVHKTKSSSDVLRRTRYLADGAKISFDEKLFISASIGKTGYSYTIF
jgi:hypothetical protein